MAESPWVKWFTSNFLNGVADLEADEIGVYAVMITLMADRGAPIEDDPKWLARRCGTSTRRFNQIRAKLLELGKLQLRNGMLGNRRMISEVEKRHAKSDQTRSAALKRWHDHQSPELPLQDGPAKPSARARTHGADANSANKSGKNATYSEEQTVLISGKSEQKPQKTAETADANASPPVRARRTERIEERITPQPDSSDSPPAEPPGPDRLANRDLQHWVDTISEASGHRPISPDALNRAFRIAQEWRDAGFDLDTVVVPTIRNIVAGSTEPTRTFGRFTQHIRHEHARRLAKGELGQRYAPPASPVLEFDGEEPVMRLIRADLLQAVGPTTYCHVAHTARLERVHDVAAGRTPLRITQNGSGRRLDDGEVSGVIRTIAKRHGFTEVW